MNNSCDVVPSEEDEDVKSVMCLDNVGEQSISQYNVLEVILGKDNYNILLSALCSVKNVNLRNKGLAAFFAKTKSYQSVECQTDSDLVQGFDVEDEQAVEQEQDVTTYPDDDQVASDAEENHLPCDVTSSQTTANIGTSPCGNPDVSSPNDSILEHRDTKSLPSAVPQEFSAQPTMFPTSCTNLVAQSSTEEGSMSKSPSELLNEPILQSITSTVIPRESTPVPTGTVNTLQQCEEANREAEGPEPCADSSQEDVPIQTCPQREFDKELQCDSKGLLEIHRAVISHDIGLLSSAGLKLQKLGYSVDQRTKPEGFTALQLALVRGCKRPLIRVLLKLGANPLAIDGRGRPTLLLALQPLHRSLPNSQPCAGHFVDMLHAENETLFEKACSQTDSRGLTVLMNCAIKSWATSMSILLMFLPTHLIDVQLSTGMTALHMAMLAYSSALDMKYPTNNSLKCIHLLKNAGASDQIPDVEGVTPDQLARTSLVKVTCRDTEAFQTPKKAFETPKKLDCSHSEKHKVKNNTSKKKRISDKDRTKHKTTPHKSYNSSPKSIVLYYSHVRVRRSAENIEKDPTLQPFVVLKKDKFLNSKAKDLKQQKCTRTLEPSVPSQNILIFNDGLPVITNVRSLNTSTVNSPDSHIEEMDVDYTTDKSPSQCSTETMLNKIKCSPKKKWLSRNRKSKVSKQEKINVFLTNLNGSRKRRYSLESISHDVEIIKKAVAMQEESQVN